MPASPSARALLSICLAACGLTSPRAASAHHDARPSRSVAGIAGAAGAPRRPGSAIGLTSTVQGVSTQQERGTTLQAELFAQYAMTETLTGSVFVPALVQLPEGQPGKLGLGALGVGVSWAYATQASEALGVLFAALRLPTQSVYLWSDPGRVWTSSLGGSHSFYAGNWSLQTAIWLLGEQRPAGPALDIGAGSLIGNRLSPSWFVGVSAEVQTRVATRCARANAGHQWCSNGRAGESFGASGSTELTPSGRIEWAPAPAQIIRLVAGAPVTRVRRVDYFAEVTWVTSL